MSAHTHSLASDVLLHKGLRRIGRLVLLLVVFVLAGCASLPSSVTRPVSAAISETSQTPLARIAEAATPQDKRHLSGFRLLPDGDHALNARIALIRNAQKSLDVQYYVIASDEVGLRFLRELRDAAERGVRVRLLVDDLYAAGQDELLAALAAHQNVQVRLFNPLPVRSGSFGSRIALSLHQFSRINRRMHNKLFIADNVFALAGGRNIANEYFMRSESANFIDMDVLASGPVVRELSTVFDTYWNNEHVYPVQSLAGETEPAAARAIFDALVHGAAAELPVTPRDRFGRTSVQEQLASGQLDQTFATAQVLADSPAKVADQAGEDTTTTSAAMNAMRTARSDLLIVSPYFVPGQSGLAMLQEVVDNKARLTVMTNSLGATDEPLVHSGYSKYRLAMLKMGVKLHELGATLSRKSGALGDFRSSLGRLHAKLAVIDQQRLFVGSMNMDGRSKRYNTELGLVIDSAELSAEVASLFRSDRHASTYQLRLAADNERIEWLATEDNREVVHHDEPDSNNMLGFKLAVLSAFIDEDML